MVHEAEASTKKATLRSNAVKAMGERIVANELTFRGWLVVNTNSGEDNAPNVDLIALRDEERVTIQVKTTSARSHKDQHFFGYYKEQGGYFNDKKGPKADLVVAVYVHSASQYNCLVLPVEEAERMCNAHGTYWLNIPKKNGQKRSPRFPIYLSEKRSSQYGVDLEPFRDAWDRVAGEIR